MNEDIEIYLAASDDIPRIWCLAEEYFASVATFAGEMSPPSKSSFVEYWSEEPSRYVIVARAESASLGFCLLQEIDGSAYDLERCLELGAIFVRKQFRGRGGSKKLWREAVRIAKRDNLSITSEVSVDNTLSRQIIGKLLADASDDKLSRRLRPKPRAPNRLQAILHQG